MNPIRIKPSTAPTIKIKPSTERIVSAAEVAKALGAKPTGVTVENAQGPITLFALRQELFRRLASTGGRPGLPDADGITKVPTSEAQRARLNELATAIATDGFSPSAGQVAHVLLGWALEQLGPDAVKKLAADMKASEG